MYFQIAETHATAPQSSNNFREPDTRLIVYTGRIDPRPQGDPEGSALRWVDPPRTCREIELSVQRAVASPGELLRVHSELRC
jgi:hypothetical protein